MKPFIFGGNTSARTPEELERQRQIIDALVSNKQPTSIGTGLAAIGDALGYRMANNRIDREEREGYAAADSEWDTLMRSRLPQPDLSDDAPTFNGDNPRNAVATSLTDEQRALLDTIAGPESAGKYNVMYGGGEFNDLSRHPGQPQIIQSGPNKGKTSTAAGRYQFLEPTWRATAEKLGLTDFSPESQDLGAWDLAATTYKEQTGRDLLADLKSGDPDLIAGAGKALRHTWTSLPGGIEQGIDAPTFVQAYEKNLPPVALPIDDVQIQPAGGQAPAPVMADASADPFSAVDPRLLQLWANPFLRPNRKKVIEMMIQQQIEAADPIKKLQREKLQLDIDAARNPPKKHKIEVINGQVLRIPEDEGMAENITPEGLPPAARPPTPEEVKQYPGVIWVGADGTPHFDTRTKIENNVGPQGIDYGKPPEGMAWKRDPEGKVLQDENGLPMALPIPGGKLWQELQDAKSRAAAGDAQTAKTRDVVGEDISRSIETIKKNPKLTTGILGQYLQEYGGTKAHNLKNLLLSIKANIGFDRLQAMRAASPTGGALGSITQNEIARLEGVYGSVEQSQTPEQLVYNLERLNEVYLDIVNGPGNRPDQPAKDEMEIQIDEDGNIIE